MVLPWCAVFGSRFLLALGFSSSDCEGWWLVFASEILGFCASAAGPAVVVVGLVVWFLLWLGLGFSRLDVSAEMFLWRV